MSQQNILVITILISLIIGMAVGIGVYYFLMQPQIISQYQDKANDQENNAISEAEEREKYEQFLQDNFPDVISGVLNLSFAEPSIKISDGKEYVLWPIFSDIDYKKNGFKDGQEVEWRGKILPKDESINILKERFAIIPGVTLRK